VIQAAVHTEVAKAGPLALCPAPVLEEDLAFPALDAIVIFDPSAHPILNKKGNANKALRSLLSPYNQFMIN
jgi:hypothetical protein